jgi:hypothetical protein
MATHVLDIVVHHVQFSESLNEIQTPVWVTLGCDGLAKRLSLPMRTPSARVTWESPARRVLSLPALDGAHLRVGLWTVGCAGNGIPIARSQIRLAALGIGPSRRLSFPLMAANDFTRPAAVMTVTARLAALPDGGRQNTTFRWHRFANEPSSVEPNSRTFASFAKS